MPFSPASRPFLDLMLPGASGPCADGLKQARTGSTTKTHHTKTHHKDASQGRITRTDRRNCLRGLFVGTVCGDCWRGLLAGTDRREEEKTAPAGLQDWGENGTAGLAWAGRMCQPADLFRVSVLP